MTHQTSKPAVPVVSVSRLTDPTAVKDGMQAVDQDVISLDERPFLAQRIMVRLGGSVLLFQHTSHRLRSYAKLGPNSMALLAIGPGAKGTIDGVSMRHDTLIIAAPGTEAELVVEPGYSSVSLLISPEDLHDHLSARGRSAEFRMPSGVEFLRSTGMTTRSFFNLGKRIAQAAKRQPKFFNESELIRVAANLEIVEALLSMISQETTFQLTQSDLKRQKFSQIIKTVVNFSELNIETPLYVSDLCRVAGVSERTLQYAFREVMETTPMAYLKLLKLHRARDDLRVASKRSTTVSALALKWGFWHFGDFSRAYKKSFHEMPSETLRASPPFIADIR